MKNQSPESWDLKMLLESWHAHLRGMIARGETDLPFERLLFQSQADPSYGDTVTNWSTMSGESRSAAWESLMVLSEKGKDEMLPICVRCGSCCKNGSPTLGEEDLELVTSGQIPLEALMTIRAGEPVHSRAMGQAYYLPAEKIKIREMPGSKVCAMYDDKTHGCALHPHKPAQCRAQSCWDPSLASDQAMAPPLSRQQVLGGADGILTVVAAHEKRASFSALVAAFEAPSGDEAARLSAALEILAFDAHVREFAVSELSLPKEALPFVFGRPLAERLHLFGMRLEKQADGTMMLLPIETAQPNL